MKIVVCIKQVPDTTDVKINQETNTLIREGVKSIINPFDMYAIEEGLLLKEAHGGSVTVISMGPAQVSESLKEAISLGVDDVILISDRAFAGADTLATSYTLSKVIAKLGHVDVIITGKQAIDGDTAQVGPGIAEWLDIPHCTYVKAIEEVGEKSIRVQRMIEGGLERIAMELPALITVVKEINEPRFPSIRGILRSREMEVPVWTVLDLDVEEHRIGLNGSPTQVVAIATPEMNTQAEIFTGKAEEQVQKLFTILRQQNSV